MNKQEQIKALFNSLSPQEKGQLIKELQVLASVGLPSNKQSHPTTCPYCQSAYIIKYGHWKQTQRYQCNTCQKTFNGATGSSRYHVKKPRQFEAYKRLMTDQYYPLHEIAQLVGVSIQTAFDWRHKILSGLKKTDTTFRGITEVDDIWFVYSQKGRKGLQYSRKRGGSRRPGDNNFQTKLLVTADRESHLDMSVVRIGRLKKADLENSIGTKCSADCTLVSDKHRSIAAFAKAHALPHVSFQANKHSAGGVYHTQQVNNVASRFKALINHRLRGVSTKYLQSYANWFAFQERYKTNGNIPHILEKELQAVAHENWHIFTNIERIYKQFIQNHSVRTYRCPPKREWKTAHIKPEFLNGLAYI